jgi:hypothetical protein
MLYFFKTKWALQEEKQRLGNTVLEHFIHKCTWKARAAGPDVI